MMTRRALILTGAIGLAAAASHPTLAAPRAKSADNTIRYNLVRDAGQWKIDDISGASDGEPWSIREMLASSLKD